MKVIATETGFDGICVRAKGDVFEWHQPNAASWMKEIESNKSSTEVEEKNHEEKKNKKRKNDQEID